MFEDLFTPLHMVVFFGFLGVVAAIYLLTAVFYDQRTVEPWMRDGRIAAVLRERRRQELEAARKLAAHPTPVPPTPETEQAHAASAGQSQTK